MVETTVSADEVARFGDPGPGRRALGAISGCAKPLLAVIYPRLEVE